MLDARFKQGAGERLRYIHSLDAFLADAETISTVAATVATGLTVDGLTVVPGETRSYLFYVSGGTVGRTYAVDISVTTSDGQVLVNRFEFSIEEA